MQRFWMLHDVGLVWPWQVRAAVLLHRMPTSSLTRPNKSQHGGQTLITRSANDAAFGRGLQMLG